VPDFLAAMPHDFLAAMPQNFIAAMPQNFMAAMPHAAVHVVALNPLDARSMITSFGLAGIFAILFAETGLLIGFFLPGDTLLALAGAFAALPQSNSSHLPLAALLIGCPIAAIVGAQVGYLIGVRGEHVIAKPGSSFAHSITRIEPLLGRFGEGWAVFLCRFIPVLRTFMNPMAGIIEMPVRRFVVANVAGGLLWTISILLAGYYAGEKLHIEKFVLPIVAAAVVLSLISLAFEMRRNRRRNAASPAAGDAAAEDRHDATTEGR
jgi:membrane-associated protein